jgi:S-adenosylmethionine:tRNA ribosyltransferase-isomerase
MRVDLFDYALPADRIAQRPRPRGASRLLVLDRRSGAVTHHRFGDLPDLLRSGDLLVRNDVRVRHARLFGKDPEDRDVEIFLLRPMDQARRLWQALARPGRRAKKGRPVRFPEGHTGRVTQVHPDGRREVLFDRALEEEFLEKAGHVPLPPYIRRTPGAPDRPEDRAAYQTVFAREPLAVAAPTAGLHFTEEVFSRLAGRGIRTADLTLAVGSGTFAPVRVEDTAAHHIEREEVFLPRRTSEEVAAAHAEGRRVVAVGTTVTRALEAAAGLPDAGSPEGDLRFDADIFITPGFDFRAVDVLLTNFHLPRSSLLMLVCAFAGRENVLAAYAEAVREDYLFYSFGDAMLIG